MYPKDSHLSNLRTPPRPSLVVTRAVSLLNSDAALQTLLGGTNRNYPHARKPERPAGTDPFWAITVFRSYRAATKHTASGSKGAQFQLMVECPPAVGSDGSDDHTLTFNRIASIHDRAFKLLNGARFDLPEGSMAYPLVMVVQPSEPHFDSDAGVYYSTAVYKCVIRRD